jgi:DNA ligase-1
MFIAYDLLYLDGAMLTGEPIELRRSRLVEVLSDAAPQWSVASVEHIDRNFAEARERGNEGLVLKRRGSVYEAGKRSGAWLKVKRPYATLDVVVTAAEQGHGRRAIFLSDYTFGVRDGDHHVNVGKAYSGLTDAEVRELTRILRAAATDRFGRVVLVRPEVVLEVAFDGIQKSSRHKGGYALRFPRILRWRRDKQPDEADTLDRVRELYEASIAR